jgi:Fe2+ transport system protein FeoA
MAQKKLSEIAIGESARILEVDSGFLAAKMADLGLFQGNDVSVVFKAPFGDPMAVSVGGTMISLRMDEAQLISVER